MKKMIVRLFSLPKKIGCFCTPSNLESVIRNAVLNNVKPTNNRDRKKVILIECVEDIYYLGLFGKICVGLKAKEAVRVDQFILRSVNVGESASLKIFFFYRIVLNSLHNFKWIRLYGSFVDRVGYRNFEMSPTTNLIDMYRAYGLWRGIESRLELSALVINDVLVGDLINDTYLRFKPASTIDLNDIYLFVIIWQACSDVRKAIKYFSSVKPSIYLTSYSTYTQHGIPVRVALHNNVRVFSFGNLQEFLKELKIDDWVHTKNPLQYAEIFLGLDAKNEKLERADRALSIRLSGGIDAATSYMKKSSYVESDEIVPNVGGAVIVFLHDFYDSPHVYYDLVFPDFWEWICFTIETLSNAGISFFIKPHPNQIALSDSVLLQLKERYEYIQLISPRITNMQLVKAGAACAVTVYGTVSHEMAYLGVPSITCARHPHVSFDFCINAKSRQQYKVALEKSVYLEREKDQMRKQSLTFYYMHNLDLSAKEMKFRDVLLTFRSACLAADLEPNAIEKIDSAADGLRRLSENEVFEEYLNKLVGSFR